MTSGCMSSTSRRLSGGLGWYFLCSIVLTDIVFSHQVHPRRTQESGQTLSVCVVHATALAECLNAPSQQNYTGYEVDIWSQLTERLATEYEQQEFAGTNWQFVCVDRTTAITELYKRAADPSRLCNVSLGAITFSSDLMRKGVQFSPPTYEGSLELLIAVPDGSMSIWTFMQPFKRNLWLALFGTGAAVALSVWLQEVPWKLILTRPVAALQKLSNMQWDAVAVTIQIMAEFRARRVGARITVLGFSFLVLIIMNTYTATLASRLTVRSLKLVRNSLRDMAEQPVGVLEDNVENVREHTPLQQPVPLQWNGPEDELETLRRLRSGELAALLMESSWTQYVAATTCDLYVVGTDQRVLAFRYGFAFARDFPPSILADMSRAMAELVEEGVLSDLEAQYIKPLSSCPSKVSPSDLVMMQLGVKQLSGLWIFLGAAMALGWAIDGGVSAWKSWRRRRGAERTCGGDATGAAAPAAGATPPTSGGGAFDQGSLKGGAKGAYGNGSPKGIDAGGAELRGDSHLALGIDSRFISESGISIRSFSSRLEGRSKSFFGRPEVAESWMAVADASTVEEMVQLLEMQVLHMDQRLRTALDTIERRIETGQLRMAAAVAEFTTAVAAGSDGAGGGKVAAEGSERHGWQDGGGRTAVHGAGAVRPSSTPHSTPVPTDLGLLPVESVGTEQVGVLKDLAGK